jgi:hypothetical protein
MSKIVIYQFLPTLCVSLFYFFVVGIWNERLLVFFLLYSTRKRLSSPLFWHVKLQCAILLLFKEGTLRKQFQQWTLLASLTAPALPAVQNSLLQISYRNLDPLPFSTLDQTKLFFATSFTFLILGYTDFTLSSQFTHLLIIQLMLPSRYCNF